MKCKKKKREESIFPAQGAVKYLAVWIVPGGDMFDIMAAEWQEPDGQTKSRMRYRNEVNGEKTTYDTTGGNLDSILGGIVAKMNVKFGENYSVAKLNGNEFWQRIKKRLASATIVDGVSYVDVCVDGGEQNV